MRPFSLGWHFCKEVAARFMLLAAASVGLLDLPYGNDAPLYTTPAARNACLRMFMVPFVLISRDTYHDPGHV